MVSSSLARTRVGKFFFDIFRNVFHGFFSAGDFLPPGEVGRSISRLNRLDEFPRDGESCGNRCGEYGREILVEFQTGEKRLEKISGDLIKVS